MTVATAALAEKITASKWREGMKKNWKNYTYPFWATFALTADKRKLVEPRRLELLTFSLRTRRQPLI